MAAAKTNIKDIIVSSYELEGVRKAPGMYVGGLDAAALSIIVKEPIDNVDDQMALGHAKKCVVIRLDSGRYAVLDDGEGIPIEVHPVAKKSGLTVVLTKLHAGTKSTSATKTQLRGVHGVGVSVTNALCQKFEAYTHRKVWHHQAFAQGRETSGVTKAKLPAWVATLPKTHQPKGGTLVVFEPDTTLFKDVNVPDDALLKMLKFNAYLRPKTSWVYLVKTPKGWTETVFKFEKGMADLLADTLTEQGAEPRGKPLFYTSEDLTIIAQWTTGDGAILSSVNGSPTPNHGTHVKAALTALKASLQPKTKLQNEDVCNGLILLVNASVLRPVFNAQTKDELKSELPLAAQKNLKDAWARHWLANKTLARDVLKFSAAHAKAREDFKDAQRALRGVASDKKAQGRVASENFRPALNKNLSQCTLYIVEGKSAGAPATGARDKKTQALLMLRGKIVNCFGTRASKALQNKEVSLLLSVLGFDGTPNWHKKSYKEVVILSDADEDGGHISLLLLGFFLRFAPEFLAEGRLHRITDASLFKAYFKGQYVFGKTLADVRLKTTPSTVVQRIKGWGEIDERALRFIAFGPERKLFRINSPSKKELTQIQTLLSSTPQAAAVRRSLLGLSQKSWGADTSAAEQW